MTDLSMTSDLRHSERLGRRIRTGDARTLGVPTEDLALAALADGDHDSAREYFDYSVEEKTRVRAIFDTWLDALLEYGRDELPGFEAEVERLTELIGIAPPTDAATLGRADAERALAALERGDRPEFEAALRDQREAALTLHDAQADWAWGLLSSLRDGLGEERMDDVFRVTQGNWVSERYAALGEMTPQESLELTIEGMRGHFTGPARAGRIDVAEEDDRWILSFDPCGSGGRMRRSDSDRGQTPRTEAPFSFAVTEEAHDWSWGRKGVCLYCAHCAVVNEIIPIETLGAPMRMTENPENPDDQCRWTIYKSPELVPDWVYERVGKQPPARA
jgi:hypothetical protein